MDKLELKIIALGDAYLRLRNFQNYHGMDDNPDRVPIDFVSALLVEMHEAALLARNVIMTGPTLNPGVSDPRFDDALSHLGTFIFGRSAPLEPSHSIPVQETEKELLLERQGMMPRSELLEILERLYQAGRRDERESPLNAASTLNASAARWWRDPHNPPSDFRDTVKSHERVFRGTTQQAAQNRNYGQRPDADGYLNGN